MLWRNGGTTSPGEGTFWSRITAAAAFIATVIVAAAVITRTGRIRFHLFFHLENTRCVQLLTTVVVVTAAAASVAVAVAVAVVVDTAAAAVAVLRVKLILSRSCSTVTSQGVEHGRHKNRLLHVAHRLLEAVNGDYQRGGGQ